MAATSRRSTRQILRSGSPADGYYSSAHKSSPLSYSSSAFASSTSLFAPSSPSISRRAMSPTRVSLYPARTNSNSASSVRFSADRSGSPGRSVAVSNRGSATEGQRRTCMCSPTKHPGSFRCSLHKSANPPVAAGPSPCSTNRLNMRRSAMTNSLVRIGTVEGDLVKRALGALIRPSSHQQRRRLGFQRRPSRLSTVSNA